MNQFVQNSSVIASLSFILYPLQHCTHELQSKYKTNKKVEIQNPYNTPYVSQPMDCSNTIFLHSQTKNKNKIPESYILFRFLAERLAYLSSSGNLLGIMRKSISAHQ